jgi:hypothetical protein
MFTKNEALQVLSRSLQERNESGDPFVVVDENTIEASFGWVFFYNSKKFLGTGISRHRLAGNGPVLFNRGTGEIVFCGSGGGRVEEYIADYERKLEAQKSRPDDPGDADRHVGQ